LLLGAPLGLLETASSYSSGRFGPLTIEGLSVRAEIDRAPGQHCVRCHARLARCGRLKKERSPGRGRSGALVCRVSPRFWQIVMAGKVPRPPRFRQQPRIRKDARV